MFAGTIFVFVVGPCVSIQTMAIINGVAPPIFFLLFSLCPESPYYYIMRGRHADAARTLAWLRGGAPIESELTSIQTSIEREAKAGQGYFRKMLSLVTVPANRKAFFIVEVMNFLQRYAPLCCDFFREKILIFDDCSLGCKLLFILPGFNYLQLYVSCTVMVR